MWAEVVRLIGANLEAAQADIVSSQLRMRACIAADTALSRRAALIKSVPVTVVCL